MDQVIATRCSFKAAFLRVWFLWQYHFLFPLLSLAQSPVPRFIALAFDRYQDDNSSVDAV